MNKDLQDKLQQLAATPEIIEKMTELNKDGDVTSAQIIDFWKAQGVELTEEDLKVPTQNLSDDELDAVVGGGGCGCCVTGGGWGDEMRCECIGAGVGGINYYDRNGRFHNGDEGGYTPSYGWCTCIVAGAGATNRGSVAPHILQPNEYENTHQQRDTPSYI